MNNTALKDSTDTKHENVLIKSLLTSFNRATSRVEASAVISRDGFTIAAAMGGSIDVNRSAAMCASLLALSDTASREFKRGKLKQVMLDCDHGVVVVLEISTNAALAIITQEKINLGMLFFSAQRTGKQIADILATHTQ